MKKLHYYLLSLLLVAPVTFAAIGEPTPDLKNKVFNQAYEKRPMLAMLFENITNLMQTSIGATFAIIYTISVVLGFIGFKMMHKGAVKKDGGDLEIHLRRRYHFYSRDIDDGYNRLCAING